MTTVVSGDGKKPREEDSSSNSISNTLVSAAPRHFTLKNIASQIDLLDILIVAGVGYALKTGKLLNWIRKPWDLFQRWIEDGYTGPENELKSLARLDKMSTSEAFSDLMDLSDDEDDIVQLAQKKHSRWCLGSHKYSGTPDLKGFKGIGETYTGLRQNYCASGSSGAGGGGASRNDDSVSSDSDSVVLAAAVVVGVGAARKNVSGSKTKGFVNGS